MCQKCVSLMSVLGKIREWILLEDMLKHKQNEELFIEQGTLAPMTSSGPRGTSRFWSSLQLKGCELCHFLGGLSVCITQYGCAPTQSGCLPQSDCGWWPDIGFNRRLHTAALRRENGLSAALPTRTLTQSASGTAVSCPKFHTMPCLPIPVATLPEGCLCTYGKYPSQPCPCLFTHSHENCVFLAATSSSLFAYCNLLLHGRTCLHWSRSPQRWWSDVSINVFLLFISIINLPLFPSLSFQE